ncbi:MAG: NADP-reducing hydrogenase subunit HndC [candidate division WS2 bacterium]|uniref:NADP-reducing hydrogenase subunit HndC n=1 Tax=Psychracetigena formicireducens TaxID=2986056 RepID=A0A9E2BF87_PSYF1|nr:NADP-reducing hydrogenase subunit HndC [Candidatus Psychracetigena formicireducens]MBT9144526.1 NADP-reducing hydrogenase subunit HndC [Candidatus Psychracetigena formicireducens]
MMNLDKLREQALQEWKEIKYPKIPIITVGSATCGRAAGALDVLSAIKTKLEENSIQARVFEVGCIGMCYGEVMIEVTLSSTPPILYHQVNTDIAQKIIEEHLLHNKILVNHVLGTRDHLKYEGINPFSEHPFFKNQVRIALRNCGIIDPENINHYLANEGYKGIEKALSLNPIEVIEEIKKSGLRGRGGGGFPTGTKWDFCYKSDSDKKYLICNADEGDPGAFMDRSLLEGDPHSVLEGMLIGAYAIGANEGYIYVRAEYPLAITRLKIAIKQMEEVGLLGDSILGSNFSFKVKIKEGAGAFVCGEETALIASIEGKRGMPRSRPPFPAEKGLWEKPTIINNVETLANVSAILIKDAEWYSSYGTDNSKGTKTFALAGKVNHTGLIEVPMGMTLNNIIFNIGGGIPHDKKFKAVQTGGPSGGCIPSTELDLPVDYDSLASVGSIMGSGGMVVMDEETCMVDIARYFLDFTQKESCGKCVPCRLGTKQLLLMLEKITQGKGEMQDLTLLYNLAEKVKSGSLCGLGQTAPNPILTTLKYFRDEYILHIQDKVCPAKVCKNLIYFKIDPDKCKACALCFKACPVNAIKGAVKQVHVIEQDKCIKCGVCLEVCPPKFNAVLKLSGEEEPKNE